jgi:hypothetical protein
MSKYYVKVYDAREQVNDFIYENHDICLESYEDEIQAVVAAINLYDELNNAGEPVWTLEIEVGVYVDTLTRGSFQQVGYIEFDGEYTYEEMF